MRHKIVEHGVLIPYIDTRHILSLKSNIIKRRILTGDAFTDQALAKDSPHKIMCGCTLTEGWDSGVKYPTSGSMETYNPIWEQEVITLENPYPPHYPWGCRLIPLRKGEEVYDITVWINKRFGRTQTEHWRRKCWEKVLPKYTELSNLAAERELAVSMAAKPKSIRLGRPVSDIVTNLSPEQATERKRLMSLWHNTREKRKHYNNELLVASTPSTRKVKVVHLLISLDERLNGIYNKMQELGGAPSTWADELGLSKAILSEPHFLNARQLSPGYVKDRDEIYSKDGIEDDESEQGIEQ